MGRYKLNTIEDLAGGANLSYDLDQLSMGSPTKLNSSTKKGVFIIKELVCKDLPEDIELLRVDEDFRINSERKVI